VVTFRHDYDLALMLSRDRGAPRRTRPEEKDRSMRKLGGQTGEISDRSPGQGHPR
jgi:hypothetical protein